MVFEAGRMKWREHQQREQARRTMEYAEYVQRVERANLAPLPAGDYKGAQPISMRSWLLHRSLLQAEGLLDDTSETSIKLGIEAAESRALQDQVFHEEMRLQSELREGNASTFISWLDEQGIQSTFALRGVCRPLLTWEAIRRLGLEGDTRFAPQSKTGQEALQAALRERDLMASFSRYISGAQPSIESPTDPATQCASLLDDYIPVRLAIPASALKVSGLDWSAIRYHPVLGLVVGFVHHYSYFDRGAGSFPGARGTRVHEYSADVRLFLPLIKGRKVSPPLSRQSVWVVSPEAGAVIGRWSGNEAVHSSLRYCKIFDSEAGARAFLHGTIASAFWQSTLPVRVHFNRDQSVHELDFRARPLSSLLPPKLQA